MALLFLLVEYLVGYPNVLNYTDLLIGVLELFGLFGYVFRFRVFGPRFWKGAFLVCILYDVVTSFLEFSGWTWTIYGWVLSLPLYIAIYRYGYRSQQLWERD